MARRKLQHFWQEVIKQIADFSLSFPNPRPLTIDTHRAALTIAARNKLAFYGSLLIASALEAGCTRVMSEDMQHGRVIDRRLTIRKPFLEQ